MPVFVDDLVVVHNYLPQRLGLKMAKSQWQDALSSQMKENSFTMQKDSEYWNTKVQILQQELTKNSKLVL